VSVLAGLLVYLSVFIAQPRSTLGRLAPPPHSPRAKRGTASWRAALRTSHAQVAACVGGCGAGGWAVHGTVGAAAGLVGGAAVAWWIRRLEPAEVTRTRRQVSRALPLAVDLLAACVSAGQPVHLSLETVTAAVGGPLADRLSPVCARLSLGADPVTAWRLVAGDPQLAALSRTMVRALDSGAPIASGLGRLAEDVRRTAHSDRQMAARTVGVRAAGPLALCFLPAFMLIGVVPAIVSAFAHLGW
jgi:Flp pilus assembly protein TadB